MFITLLTLITIWITDFIFFRLLVGAPAADSGQPGVQEGGAVYKCRPESPNQCEIIPFAREGKQMFPYRINTEIIIKSIR